MKNLLFVTTAERAIRHHLTKISHRGKTDHWAISAQGGIPLAEVQQAPIRMVLLDEEEPLDQEEKDNLLQLCHQSTVHWVWHKTFNYWKDWLKNNDVLHLEHQEHSRTGTINDFFVYWSLEKTVADRDALFEKYFRVSRGHAINGLKRSYLNIYTSAQLARLGQRFTDRRALDYTEQLLLEDYPQIAEFLLLFERVVAEEEDTYYRLQLAEYLYSAD